MGFQAFLKFALICFDAFAWPAFALGYPLRASIGAIEANSNLDTKKLVTYWVMFSLISLFEHAFMGLLQWLPFWPYMKLTVVCWLMIPHFDGAFYVYNHFVHPCLYLDVGTIMNWLRRRHEFVLNNNVLAEADKNAKAHEPEALEKLIPTESKSRESSMVQKDIKSVQVTETKEIAAVSLVPKPEQIADQTQANKLAVECPESKEATGLELPEKPSEKLVQKEWTCALCLVTTSCEQNLNMHFQGRRHRAAWQELMKANHQLSMGKVSPASAVKGSKKEHERCASSSSSSSSEAAQKNQQPPEGQVSAASVVKHSGLLKSEPQKCATGNSAPTSSKTGISNGSKPDLRREEPKKLVSNNIAGKVQGQQQIEKKHAKSENVQFRCNICNIGCTRSEDLNCHLWGKKHLARIQELNSLGSMLKL